MMTAARLSEQSSVKHDLACRACRQWVVTTQCHWARAKCANRQCKLFGQQQTMYADRPESIPLRAKDS
jgi:hypothetical protein